MARIPVSISTIDTAGNAQVNISATVKNRASGTNVTLYALESGGSTVSNPLVTDANGRAFAYADRQGLRIDYTGTGFTAYTEYREDAVPPTDIVSALPGSPFDGQEIYFQNAGMATLGVLWHLRYRAGGGSYKWEYLGGAPFYTETTAGGGPTSITAGTWSNAPTTQCDVTLPLAGDYKVQAQTKVRWAAANVYITGVAVGVGGSPADGLQSRSLTAAGEERSNAISGVTLARTAGDVLRVRYFNSSTGNITVTGTSLMVTPIRVG